MVGQRMVASFFPNVLQPPIAVVCNTVHGFLVRIGLCRRMAPKYDMVAPSGITISLPGIDPHDMERRRQIALKALSERLSKVEPLPLSGPSSWEQDQNKHTGNQTIAIAMPTEDGGAKPGVLSPSATDSTIVDTVLAKT